MKKIMFIAIAVLVFGCKSGEKKDAPESQNNYPAAQNATGNIPDTTNSINLGNKTDSTDSKDSLNK